MRDLAVCALIILGSLLGAARAADPGRLQSNEVEAWAPVSEPTRIEPNVKAHLTATYSAIERAMATLPQPGLVIGVTDDDKTLMVLAHGYSELKARIPLSPNSRFALGSISKSFTAVALMELADEGRFDPGRPIREYLPSFRVHSSYRRITGGDLLSMTSGLPSYLTDVASTRFALIKLHDFRPSYAPGQHWWYSNTGFQILGYVLEDLDGTDFDSSIQHRIFDPLGMTSSGATIDDAQRTQLTTSYVRWPYTAIYVEAPWFEYTAGDASIISTAPDMCVYLRFLLNHGTGPKGRLLSKKSFAELTTPVLHDYAYGLMVHREGGDTVIGHGGQIAGFESYFEVHMNEGFGIVFLSNGGLDKGFDQWVIAAVGAALRGEQVPPAPKPKHDARVNDLAAYIGSYHPPQRAGAARLNRLVFTVNEHELFLVRNGVRTRMQRIGVDVFRAMPPSQDNIAYFFKRAPGKKPGRVIAVAHGAEWFVSTSYRGPMAHTPASWFSYTGHYRFPGPEGPDVRVFVDNGHLMMTEGDIYAWPGSERHILEPLGGGQFRSDSSAYSPERAQFDSVSNGHALRLILTGVPLYRVETP